MMHRDRLGWPTAWLVAAVLLQSGRAAAVGARADDRMAPIVAEVRTQEAKYRDIEYIVKSTIREADPKAPDRPADVTSMETRQVVLQGDRVSFKKDAHERVLASRAHREELSSYDGERTRTVVAGNCVNIHLGRFEHPDVYPAHTLTLAHYRVNFPLSVYLAGPRRSMPIPSILASTERAARSTSSPRSRPASRARKSSTASAASRSASTDGITPRTSPPSSTSGWPSSGTSSASRSSSPGPGACSAT